MTSHRGSRNHRLALGIIAIAYIVVAHAPRVEASQPSSEEALSPGQSDYVLSRLGDWLQNSGNNEELGEEGVSVDEEHVAERMLR